MCEHEWKQKTCTTKSCSLCGAIETDLNPMKYWISPKQATYLGFDYRDRETGLLVMTRGGIIETPTY